MNDKLDNYKVTFLCSRCRFILIYHEIRFPLSKREGVCEIIWIQRRSSGKLSRRRKSIGPCKLIHLSDVLNIMCLLSTWLCQTLNCVVPTGDSVPSRLLWLFDYLSLRLIFQLQSGRIQSVPETYFPPCVQIYSVTHYSEICFTTALVYKCSLYT